VSHRLRLLGRAQRRLGTGPWSVGVYDELMITLDATGRGPSRGYDRNRLYGAIMRRLSPNLTTEFGYIWENEVITRSQRRTNHVVIGVVNVAFSTRPRPTP
jgi:hypothetical protein